MGQRLNIEIIQKGKTICNVYMHWSAYTSTSKALLNGLIKGFEKYGVDRNSTLKEIVIALMKILGAKVNSEEAVALGIVKSTTLKDYYFEGYEDLLLKYPCLNDIDIKEVDEAFNDKLRAKMTSKDFKRFSSWENEASLDRNLGIISTTEEGIEETRNWEEGRISYNLDDNTVGFDLCYIRDIAEVAKEKQSDYIFEGDDVFARWNSEKDYKLKKYKTNFNLNSMTLEEWYKFSNIIDETASVEPYCCIINDVIVSWIE